MMEWFRSGGFGMFLVLAIGAGAIGFGVKALGKPTAERLATLRSMPMLILTAALFTFGTDLWAVNHALTDESVLKAYAAAGGDKGVLGIIGITEAAQALTLGGVLAMAVVVLRIVAEGRHEKKARTDAS
jgi:hypothetical protein